MRTGLMAIACALGVTCDAANAPKGDETAHVIGHAPIDPVVPSLIASAPPPIASAAPTGTGPFWEPDPTGAHAVAILREDAPNLRYAQVDQATCEAELVKRKVPFVRGELTAGVLAPVRLRGALSGGVTIHSALRPADRDHAAMEIFDCRLVLALDDFSVQLQKHGVVEMIHMSAYRPRAQFGCTAKYDGKQHCGALAVDIGEFRRADGSALVVQRDFHGRIGSSTCPARPNELWTIVCDAADRATFNVMLTPNFNAQHFNHVHVEITPDAAWMLVH